MPLHLTPRDGTLEEIDGRAALRFERALAHPPERVWRALTESSQLAAWHPSPFELEPVVGGVVRYLPPDGDAFGQGEVTEYDPPRVLAYTWGEDHLRWELRPRGDGCVLVLTHLFDDRFKAARDGAGWHLCLDALELSLEGATKPARGHGEDLPAGWTELNRAYEERFGIPPDQATPPPGQ